MVSNASSKCLLLLMALCLFGAPTGAMIQTANVPQAGISSPGAGYRIAGTIVSKADGHPLARARVTISDVTNRKRVESLITAEDGKFEFRALPTGKYSLDGAKRGFISAAYDQHEQFSTAIVTDAGLDTGSLVLKLAPTALIGGKILDEFGEPVRRCRVTLYYDDHQGGIDQIHTFRLAQTDDLGSYEFPTLMPGTYFLSASATPWYAVHSHSEPVNSGQGRQVAPAATVDRSLDVTYPLTYYPDVTETDSAAPIPLRGGERIQIDIHLNPVPALRLTFHVPVDRNTGFAFPRLEQSTFDGSTAVQTRDVRMIAPGVLEIAGIPSGRYNIRTSGAGQELQMNDVELSEDGEEIEMSRAEVLSTVKVSVRVLGDTALPAPFAVGLVSGPRKRGAWQRVDSKGEAELQRIAPDLYEVMIAGFGKRYVIDHVSAEEATVSGHTVKIAAGSSISISLTVSLGAAEIQGTAKRAGKGFAGAMIVLVPKNPEMNQDLFRRDQSDLDGTFVFHGVVPGSYTILAIENGWDLDWSQAGVIAAYGKKGQKIEVGSHVGQPLSLAEPIEVQSK